MTPPPTSANREVNFDLAKVVVEQTRQAGKLELLDSQVNQSIQNFAGTLQAVQADVQRISDRNSENNTLLHELRERSSGLERIALAVERSGNEQAGDTTSLKLEVAGMKGFVRGVAGTAAFVLTLLVALIGYIYVSDKGAQAEINLANARDISQNRALLMKHEAKLGGASQ